MAHFPDRNHNDQSFASMGAQFANASKGRGGFHRGERPNDSDQILNINSAKDKDIGVEKAKHAEKGDVFNDGFDKVDRKRQSEDVLTRDTIHGMHPQERWQSDGQDEPWNNIRQVKRSEGKDDTYRAKRRNAAAVSTATAIKGSSQAGSGH